MRHVARQALSECRQKSDEKVSQYADRISGLVTAATLGQAEEAVKIRLLDEFLDKMSTSLSFYVKAAEPLTF